MMHEVRIGRHMGSSVASCLCGWKSEWRKSRFEALVDAHHHNSNVRLIAGDVEDEIHRLYLLSYELHGSH